MTYYKVKLHADQMIKGIRTKSGFLVKNEIYTANEINKAIQLGRIDEAFVRNHLLRIEISPKHTYWFCGARFESVYINN